MLGVGTAVGHMTQSSFSPLKIPGLKLWLDAADSSTITLNGSAVSQWRDKSGNSQHVSQATGANQPIRDNTGHNGHPTIMFNASQYLDGGANLISSGDPPFELYMVLNITSLAATSTFFEVGNTTQIANQSFRALNLATGEMYLSDITNDRQTVAGVITAGTWNSQHFSAPTGAFSSSDPAFYKNNVLQTSSGGTGTGTPNINPVAFRVGGRLAGAAGDSLANIAEVIVIQNTLTTAQRNSIYNYLHRKWGV